MSHTERVTLGGVALFLWALAAIFIFKGVQPGGTGWAIFVGIGYALTGLIPVGVGFHDVFARWVNKHWIVVQAACFILALVVFLSGPRGDGRLHPRVRYLAAGGPSGADHLCRGH